MDMEVKTEFKQWCVVELFGHQKIAGVVTEQTIGGCNFIRVDVPKTERAHAFTKFYGQGAIYSMSPTTEKMVKAFQANNELVPIERYELALPNPSKSEPAEEEREYPE